MLVLERYKKLRPYVHIVFWMAYIMVVVAPGMINVAWPWKVYFPLHIAILATNTYFNFGYLINRYFKKERYNLYFRNASLVYLFGFVSILLVIKLLSEFSLPGGIPVYKIYVSSLIQFTAEYIILCSAKLAKEWYIKYETIRKRQMENMQAELRLLRTQLDSHFIFNTLNNIYLLSLNVSPKASDSILMLSDLLSYVLYESHEEKVPVTKELDFIESYINLQKLRLDSTQEIIFEKRGELQCLVMPLVLFNFVENAFKHAHGIIKDEKGTFYIFISVVVSDGVLCLRVKNGKNAAAVPQPTDKKGIGIDNSIKRLSLLYGDAYKLNIEDDEHFYSVQLKIPVDEDPLPGSR